MGEMRHHNRGGERRRQSGNIDCERWGPPASIAPSYRLWPFIFCLLFLAPSTAVASIRERESAALVLITEVYYDAPGIDEDGEWIEVANVGQSTVDLSYHKIGDAAEAGDREGMLRFPAGATVEKGEAVVIAQAAAGFRAMYGRPPDYEIRNTEVAIPEMEAYESWSDGSLALNNDGDEVVLLGPDDLVADAVNYGQSTAFFSPSVNDVPRGQSIERYPSDCDRDLAADWQPQPLPTPGEIVPSGGCLQEDAGGHEPRSIGQLQGVGTRSPYLNRRVHFNGIVTGVLEDRNTRGVIFYTIFVQDSAEDADGDPATSDAIAVFVGPRRPDVQPGDAVSVSGQVTEYYGLTEIDHDRLSIRKLSTGNPLPEAKVISLAADEAPFDYEPLEAMRVTLPAGIVVGPTHSGCGFALAAEDYPARHVIRRAFQDFTAPILPVLHHSDVDCTGFPDVKVGDRVQSLQGPLTYHFEQFKVVYQPTEALEIVTAPLPPIPEPVSLAPAAFSLASFNFYDHFDARADTGNDAEPVPTPRDVAVKRTKLARVIGGILGCPSVLGMQEVENAALLKELADALAPSCNFTYEVSHRESADSRGIDVALFSDPRRVQVRDVALKQACSDIRTELPPEAGNCPVGQEPLFSRPPLQVDVLIDDVPATVFIVHFKSKREGENETHGRRMAQARHLASLVSQRLATDRAARIIVLGDFNDYELSSPLTILTEEAGMVNAMSRVALPQRYTYNFAGMSQLVDGILLSPALAQAVASAQIIHINADFPASWAGDPHRLWRSSDHDIPIVVLEHRTTSPPTPVISAEPEIRPVPTTVAENGNEVDPGVSAGPLDIWRGPLLGAVLVALVGLVLGILLLSRR